MCPRDRVEEADIIVDLLIAYIAGLDPMWRESDKKKCAVDNAIDSIWRAFSTIKK